MIIENTATRKFDINVIVKDAAGAPSLKTYSVPHGPLDFQAGRSTAPGKIDVPDEHVALAEKDPVVAGWFASGDLVKRASKSAPAKSEGKSEK